MSRDARAGGAGAARRPRRSILTGIAGPLLAALGALCFAAPAAAVGLGALELQSGLNDTLRARIPLAGLAPGEVEQIGVRLADDAAYAREGIERGDLARRLRFRAVDTGEGRAHVLVSSDGVLREPSFSFIIEISGGGSTVRRRYDVVLSLR